MVFYVFVDQSHDSRMADIYIGGHPPDLGDQEKTVEKFTGEVDLKSFLLKSQWDRVQIFQLSDDFSEIVDELTDWIGVNLSLNTNIPIEGI